MKKPKKVTIGVRISRDYSVRDDVGCYDEARTNGLAAAIDRALRRAYFDGEANGLLVHGRITKATEAEFSKRAAKYGVKP